MIGTNLRALPLGVTFRLGGSTSGDRLVTPQHRTELVVSEHVVIYTDTLNPMALLRAYVSASSSLLPPAAVSPMPVALLVRLAVAAAMAHRFASLVVAFLRPLHVSLHTSASSESPATLRNLVVAPFGARCSTRCVSHSTQCQQQRECHEYFHFLDSDSSGGSDSSDGGSGDFVISV